MERLCTSTSICAAWESPAVRDHSPLSLQAHHAALVPSLDCLTKLAHRKPVALLHDWMLSKRWQAGLNFDQVWFQSPRGYALTVFQIQLCPREFNPSLYPANPEQVFQQCTVGIRQLLHTLRSFLNRCRCAGRLSPRDIRECGGSRLRFAGQLHPGVLIHLGVLSLPHAWLEVVPVTGPMISGFSTITIQSSLSANNLGLHAGTCLPASFLFPSPLFAERIPS